MTTSSARRDRGWFKSSFSQGETGCVEVNLDHPAVLLRDTKQHGAGPVLTVPRAEWSAFVDGVRSGEESGAGETGAVVVRRGERDVRYASRGTVTTTWHVHAGGAVVHFDDGDWTAFRRGVEAGEFALGA